MSDFTITIQIQRRDDPTQEPQTVAAPTFTIADVEGFEAEAGLKLAADATDQALTIPDSCALLIYSLDYPFLYRYATDESQLEETMCHLFWGKDVDSACHTGSVLLSGNGTNPSRLRYWLLKTTTE